MIKAEGHHRVVALVVLSGLACFALGGCAQMRQGKAMDTERMMAASGFRMKFADTPNKLEQLASLQPQRKIVSRQKDGKTVYVYADAQFCKCLYAGNEQAYDAYQRLAISKEISDEEEATAEAQEEASLNWSVWGPWW